MNQFQLMETSIHKNFVFLYDSKFRTTINISRNQDTPKNFLQRKYNQLSIKLHQTYKNVSKQCQHLPTPKWARSPFELSKAHSHSEASALLSLGSTPSNWKPDKITNKHYRTEEQRFPNLLAAISQLPPCSVRLRGHSTVYPYRLCFRI